METTPLDNKELEQVRILVVDDSSDNRYLVNRMLSRKGAIIIEAANGKEAIDAALTSDIQIILMDVQMPVMDGLEATRALRERGFKKPILALTGHALVEERERCFQAGADAHIVKPINFTDLINSIKSFVSHGASNH